MTQEEARRPLRLGLPKGRMERAVLTLLSEAGIDVMPTARDYRPAVSLADTEAKILKPQNLLEMLDAGSRDIGFAGADWVAELGLDVVELLDTGLDPVRVVAAAPADLDLDVSQRDRSLLVVSEYEQLASGWIAERGLDARLLRSYGATEVFPPEDADIIVDNTATGSTLRANGLAILDVVMPSSTRLYASPRALEDPSLRGRIEDIRLLVASVLEARQRVMLELNAPANRLDELVAMLPAMREVTVAPLFGDGGFALRVAVPRPSLPLLIPAVRAAGGTDLVVTNVAQIVP